MAWAGSGNTGASSRARSIGVLELVEGMAGTRLGHFIRLAVNIEGHTWSINHGAIQNGTGDWNGDDVGEQAKLQGKGETKDNRDHTSQSVWALIAVQ